MGFQGGFSNSRKSSILMKEEGSGEVKRVSTLIVSSGTLTVQDKFLLILEVLKLKIS
jgi:hypothetical protein